jgi:DNA modification methylase
VVGVIPINIDPIEPTDGFRIEWIETAKLRPAEYNPRKDLQPSDPEYIQIQKSINEFGLVDPLVVNSDMTVIGGHQRLKVLTGAGFEKVPCSIVTLDKTKEKALNIALNKISGEWDFPKLKDLIVELDTGGFDLDTVGWTPKELDDVFSKLGGWRDEKEEDFDVDEAIDQIKEPVSKRGDIWLCGRHRIMCGDSTNAEDVGRLMDGKKAVLVMSDPPYNVEYTGGSTNDKERKDSYVDKWTDAQYTDWLMKIWANGNTYSDNQAALLIWFASAKIRCVMDAFEGAGYLGRTIIVWNKLKAHYGALGAQYKHRFEPLYYCYKKNQSPYFYGASNECTVWDYEQPRKNDLHPTMKPVELYKRCVLNHSASGEIVLEMFGGSGTTLIAAEQTNRTCYGMEIEPLYVDVSVKRWEEYTGGKGVLSGTPT